MAWLQLPIACEYTFVDDDGAEASTSMHLPYSALSSAESIAAAFAPIVAGPSDCSLKRYDIIVSRVLDPAPLVAGADLRRVGQFFYTTADELLWSATLPGIKNSVLIPPGPTSPIGIDLLNPAVAAYVAAMIGGLVGVQPCDQFGGDLAALAEAYRQWR